MSESAPTSSPDMPPKKDTLHVEGLHPAMQLSAVEELRSTQQELENRLVDTVDNKLDLAARAAKRREARAQFDDLIKEHLKINGITHDDPKFDEYVALLKDYSIDQIPQDLWEKGTLDDEGNIVPPMRLAVVDDLRAKYNPSSTSATPPPDPTATAPVAPPPPPAPKTSAEVKAIIDADPTVLNQRNLVASLQEELADLAAIRQGRFWSNKDTQAEYAQVEEEYRDAVAHLAKLELDAERAAGISRTETEERLDVAFKLVEQFKNLQEQTVEKLKGTAVGKFVTFMTSGGTVKRIIKGATIGVAAGAVGAAITLFTGGAGGALLAAGAVSAAAATKATAFARGYATFDNRQGRGMSVVTADGRDSEFNQKVLRLSGADGQNSEATIDLVNNFLLNKLENDTKVEQSKRKKAALKSLGAVAVGASLVELAHIGADIMGVGNQSSLQAAPHNSGISPDTDPHVPEGKVGGVVEHQVPSTPEKVYSVDALTIRPGEGWYETFKSLGIPKQEWASLLKETGPQLSQMQVNGHPLAYQMPNGQWGIRMTPDGKMPKEALDLISNTHAKLTGVPEVSTTHVTPAAEVTPDSTSTTPATPLHPAGTEAVPTAGGSLADAIQEAAAPSGQAGSITTLDVIQPSDVAGSAVLEKFTHVASWYSPDMFAQNLGLSFNEWNGLQTYIIDQTEAGNQLYQGVFTVNSDGDLRFTTNRIPTATMADILNHTPERIRTGA